MPDGYALDSFVFVDDEPARERTSARLHESVPGAEWSALGLLYAGIRRDPPWPPR